jgi:hypothetical protein
MEQGTMTHRNAVFWSAASIHHQTKMLPLDDNRWSALAGGYRVPYDPRPALARLRHGDASAWDELWQELHHQGDVGPASYAAVPHLVQIHRDRDEPDWQTCALIGTIELCRLQRHNPQLPDWLEAGYKAAWDSIIALACRDLPRTNDDTTVQSILGAVALAKGIRRVGEILIDFTADELEEMVKGYRGS